MRELGVVDDAAVLQLHQTSELVGAAAAGGLADVLTSGLLLLLHGRHFTLRHGVATSDEVHEHAEKRQHDDEDDPHHLGETTVLGLFKINLGPLLAGAGIAGIAVGTITRIGNKNRNWSQGTVDILVGLDVDLDHAIELCHNAAIEACTAPAVAEVILEEPRILGVERIDVNGTVVRIAVRTQPGKQGPVLREIRLAVKRTLDAEGISFHPPSP